MLWTQDIKVGYGHCAVAAHEGKIAFAKAELICVIGTNGAGKSTLLRALAGSQPMLEGGLYWGQNKLKHMSAAERAQRIAVVLTERSFSHFLTVRELLELSRAPYTNFIGQLQQTDLEFIAETMNTFDIQGLADRRLGTLSDGQLQRTLIARAVVQDTAYILMDEPTNHLDINHKADLLLQLRNYCHSRGKTIIYATHELQLAMALCDKVVSIHQGQISYETKMDFVNSGKLEKMFPSSHLYFKQGDINYNFPEKNKPSNYF